MTAGALLAALPYRTFPTVPLGPVELYTFGVAVAVGVLAGITVAARLAPAGVTADDVVRLGVRLVVAGIIGARLTWVLTHLDAISGPLDVVAVWQGGLQFSGGFLMAVVVGIPVVRSWAGPVRWPMLDRLALGLTVGMAIGRVGCYAVGEHLGRPTRFVLGSRYLGGDTVEGPLRIGEVVHQTALYELLHLLVLAAVLYWMVRRSPARIPAGAAVAVFCLWYGSARFLTDTLRAYDDRTAGLTGAQWMCLVLVPVGVVLLWAARRRRSPAPA